MSDIFVGIPVLNRCDLLRRCVASIDFPARILIVNNNNVDREFNTGLRELQNDFPALTLVHQPRNLGVAASWNVILEMAFAENREWAIIGSNDVEADPGAFENALPEIGRHSAGIWHLCAWNFFAISRATVERVGWFDENLYPAYKEDQDYSYRCELARVPRLNIADLHFSHLGSATIHSNDAYWRQNEITHFEDNCRYYCSKWGGDAGDEKYQHPFNDSSRDHRWWPSPRNTVHERDWDRNGRRLRNETSAQTLSDLYRQASGAPSDINEHLPILHELASAVRDITESGTGRGNSTTAFLAALPDRMITYDVIEHPHVAVLRAAARREGTQFCAWRCDIRQLESIEPTDLLFTDSQHTYRQVRFELGFAKFVRKYIVLHDTETFGSMGEDGGIGIWPAITDFLRNSPDWELHAHYPHNNGLTVLRRRS